MKKSKQKHFKITSKIQFIQMKKEQKSHNNIHLIITVAVILMSRLKTGHVGSESKGLAHVRSGTHDTITMRSTVPEVSKEREGM